MDELFTLIRQRKAIIFAGSGISLYAGYPTATKLAEFILENIPRDQRKSGVTALPDVAELYRKIFGRNKLIELIRPIFEIEPASIEYHELLTHIPQIRTVITTNYDRLFELAYGEDIQVILTKEDLVHSDLKKVTLLKIHGSIDKPDSILITKSDYEDFLSGRKLEDLLWNEVKSLFGKHAVVFIGYSLEDSDVRHVLIDILNQIGEHHKGIFLISPKVAEYDVEALVEKFGIKYYNSNAESFISKLKEEIELHKLEDYNSGYITDDEIHEMLTCSGYLCGITIHPEGSKSVSISQDQTKAPIPVDFDIKNKKSQTPKKIEGFLSGKSFEPISLAMEGKESEITLIAKGIGILPTGGPGSGYTLIPQPANTFKAVLRVKDTDIIFTDLNGETYRSSELVLIKIIHPLFVISFKLSRESPKVVVFNLQYEGTNCPIKDYSLYNMLNAWKSGNPLIIGIDNVTFSMEVSSEALQNKPELLDNINFSFEFIHDLLVIQDFFDCIFWHVSEITDEDYDTISLLLRIAHGEEIHINSCSGIISNAESRSFIKQLTEETEKSVHFGGKRLIKLFGVSLVLDFEADIQDAYIDEIKKVFSEIEKGTENVLIVIKSRSENTRVKFKKPTKI